jgi:hypothetical protein
MMRGSIGSTVRTLAIASLIFYGSYAITLQPFALTNDPKLVAVLNWRHYGSMLSPLVLWYGTMTGSILSILALFGIALGIPAGRWALLGAFAFGLVVSGFGGLAVMTALPRTLGGIAQLFAVAALTLSFIGSSEMVSNQRYERPVKPNSDAP